MYIHLHRDLGTLHICYHLWYKLKLNSAHGDLLSTEWPRIDKNALLQDEIYLTLQINGKVRGKKLISKELNQDEIELEAKTIENVAANLKNQEIKKVIYIKEKIINFVI